jgi:hypothetical protein
MGDVRRMGFPKTLIEEQFRWETNFFNRLKTESGRRAYTDPHADPRGLDFDDSLTC